MCNVYFIQVILEGKQQFNQRRFFAAFWFSFTQTFIPCSTEVLRQQSFKFEHLLCKKQSRACSQDTVFSFWRFPERFTEKSYLSLPIPEVSKGREVDRKEMFLKKQTQETKWGSFWPTLGAKIRQGSRQWTINKEWESLCERMLNFSIYNGDLQKLVPGKAYMHSSHHFKQYTR